MKRIFIVLIFLAFYACSENKNIRLWDDDLLDPNNNSNPPAEINVLNPILDRQAMQADANDDSTWAGVGEIEIMHPVLKIMLSFLMIFLPQYLRLLQPEF